MTNSASAPPQFLAFFDETVGDVYDYLLHRTRVPEVAADLTIDVYFTLLKRSKLFWWKNVTGLGAVMKLADKALAGVSRWKEEAAGDAYVEGVLECLRCAPHALLRDQMRIFLHTLRGLSLADQKIAVLALFLHWPAERVVQVLGGELPTLRQEYDAVLRTIAEHLAKEEAFAGVDAVNFCISLHCPSLAEARKTALREALMERSASFQMSSLRFALPVAVVFLVFGAFMGGVVVIGTYVLPPVPLARSLQEIAAVEVLLGEHERRYQRDLLAVEQNLRGIAASYAQEDLAKVTIELAALALREQLVEREAADEILEGLGARIMTGYPEQNEAPLQIATAR